MVKPEYIFPLLLILLDVGAAVVYAVQKDYKKAVYLERPKYLIFADHKGH